MTLIMLWSLHKKEIIFQFLPKTEMPGTLHFVSLVSKLGLQQISLTCLPSITKLIYK